MTYTYSQALECARSLARAGSGTHYAAATACNRARNSDWYERIYNALLKDGYADTGP